MSRPRADEVDVNQLAAQGAVVERRFRLSDFVRLRGLLAVAVASEPPGREIRARFSFALEQGSPAALVEVEASLPLTCQRCLQPVEWPVVSSSRLAFVDAAEGATTASDGRDAFETRAGHVALIEIAEEELLLALPLVATHPDPAACEALVPPVAEPEKPMAEEHGQRPFEGLKELLGKK
jgi:uncharacterized protein